MTSWIVAGAFLACGLAIFGLALWWLRRDNRDLGKSEAERDAGQQALDSVEKANAARDRVVTDPAYRDELHKRFDRP